MSIFIMTGCSQIPERTQPNEIQVDQREVNGVVQYVYCSPDAKEWGCMTPTIKTLISEMSQEKMKSGSHYVLFGFNQYSVNSFELRVLQSFASENINKKIVISGYTDNQGGYESNKIIATKRVNSIKNILTKNGILRKNIKLEINPLCCYLNDNSNNKDKRKNRRVEIKSY